MSSVNFKPKRTAAASRSFLATARLSCLFLFRAVIRLRLLFVNGWASVGYVKIMVSYNHIVRYPKADRRYIGVDKHWVMLNRDVFLPILFSASDERPRLLCRNTGSMNHSIRQPGPRNGLLLTLHVDQNDYLCAVSASAGFRVCEQASPEK